VSVIKKRGFGVVPNGALHGVVLPCVALHGVLPCVALHGVLPCVALHGVLPCVALSVPPTYTERHSSVSLKKKKCFGTL
jgi:hypothetical protein